MLKDDIKKDMIAAMKSGDRVRRSALSMVLSAVKNKELDKRGRLSKQGIADAELDTQSQLNDEETRDVITTEIKKRKESVLQFRAGHRDELADNEQAEIEVLMVYMPQQMSEDEIRPMIAEVIQNLGATNAKDLGKVLGAVMPRLKGKADGAVVNRIAQEMLSN